MWLGLALLAIVLGFVSLAMLIGTGSRGSAPAHPPSPKPASKPALPPSPAAPPPEAKVARNAAARPAPTTPRAAPVVANVASVPPADAAFGDDEVTYISNRADLAAELRLIVPSYIDEEARTMPTPPPSGERLWVNGAFRATRGTKRERHEDAFSILASGVYAIADGAGGHAGGNVASKTAVAALEAAIESGDHPRPAFAEAVPLAAETLVGAVLHANAAVFAKSKTDTSLAGMGTTLVALKIDAAERRLYIASVGDSRCYRVRKGTLAKLTNDHVVEEKDEGGKTKQMLARAIGVRDGVAVDLFIGTAEPGDRYLLCTDGLYRALDDLALTAALTLNADLHEAAGKLVADAEAADPSDNISVVLVDVKG